MVKTSWFPLSLFFVLQLASTTFVSKAGSCRALFAPVTRDPAFNLFTLTLNTNEKFFIHIGAPLLVRRCGNSSALPNTFPPRLPCQSRPCLLARSNSPPQCSAPQNTVLAGRCACTTVAYDPIADLCSSNLLTPQNVAVSATGPGRPNAVRRPVLAMCVPDAFVDGLPPGVFGVAGLSRAPVALSNQLTAPGAKRFAMCLPQSDGSGKPGVVFFGNGPYFLNPPASIDASRLLSYTPLIKKQNLNEYYIRLRTITVSGKVGNFPSNALNDVMLSTITPYTTLHTDLYNALVKDFSEATKDIPRAANVSPFGLCLNTTGIKSGPTGLDVPRVDFVVGSGKSWPMYGSNTMKTVAPNVACFAFVDGGTTAKLGAVIGLHQMENNLLVFDLARSVLGFSSSLSLVKGSCSDFRGVN